MQLEQKQKFTKNRGCLPKCKKVFFWYVFFAFWWFCFLLPVFVLCFVKKAQEGYFPAILEVFCQFCSHQRPVLKCFFSSYFVFFAFVFLFKNPFLYFLFVHQPLFNKRLFVGFLLFFFCLSFPFLSFACLFDTNFPNIPFLKSNLLLFLPVSFFLLLLLFLFSLWKSPRNFRGSSGNPGTFQKLGGAWLPPSDTPKFQESPRQTKLKGR